MNNPTLHPESAMMSYGFHPQEAHGAVKAPLYQTSTFTFATAEQGKAYFELAYGLREPSPNESIGMIYSRLDNPNLSLVEKRLAVWENAEAAAAFESGMAAISTVFLTFLKPGDVLLFSNPTYGGTDHFIHEFLPSIGIEIIGFRPWQTEEEIVAMLQATGKASRLRMIYAETPANPTNHLVDLAMCSRIARRFSTEEKDVLFAVDNTYLGPLWQHPLQHGADLVLYSATKYIAGHSDVIAGAVLGSELLIQQVKGMRTFMGNMASPHTSWLLLRSLETLKLRMDKQLANAQEIATYLATHPQVERVYYLGHLPEDSEAARVYHQQCLAPGAMISFDMAGGETEAFQFLNSLRLVKLAVSLGSTESLAQHPRTMTHAGVSAELCEEMGITPSLIRLSVGVEHPEDIQRDLAQAFESITTRKPQLATV